MKISLLIGLELLAWPEEKKHNAFSPVKISLFAILLEKHQLNCLKHNTGPFTKHLLPLCYQQTIDKTSSNLIMCRMPQIAKRPLQHHSNVRCNLVFSCFVLCFSCSEIIYSDLKYIVYVFMNALEHCETSISYFISVQGRSCKEIKKKLQIFSTILLHYISHFDFYDNFQTHDIIISGKRTEGK